MNVEECIEKRFLLKIKPDKKLVDKELKECNYDFNKAKKAFKEEDYKWTIVKSYYAMFHSVNALLRKIGIKVGKQYAHDITTNLLLYYFYYTTGAK